MSSITKLVTQLQKAHAGELGAYYAYRGHTRATKDIYEKLAIQKIKNDEWDHKEIVYALLDRLGERPSKIRDAIFMAIGKILGFLCKYAGRNNNLRGALLIEKIGTVNYLEMSNAADALGLESFAIVLKRLYCVEVVHECTLKTYLAQNKG